MPRLLGNRTFPFVICAGFTSAATFYGRNYMGRSIVIGRYESLEAPSNLGTFYFTVPEFTSRNRMAFSIGQRSLFLQNNGSVDFIYTDRGGGVVRFNSTSEVFESDSCVYGSVVNLPNESSFLTNITIGGFNETVQPRELQFAPSEVLLSLPSDMFRYIENIANATQTSPARIHDCDSVLSRLPTIDIRFLSSNSWQGTIRLYPEDYVRRIHADSCELMLNGDSWYSVPFNPLMIRGLNMRFESERIRFCDAAF